MTERTNTPKQWVVALTAGPVSYSMLPPPLVHAVATGLLAHGLELHLREAPGRRKWIPAATAEPFYAWIRAQPEFPALSVRVRGPAAVHACPEVIALFDRGDSALVVRGGFAAYPPRKTIPGFDRSAWPTICEVETAEGRSLGWLFWRKTDGSARPQWLASDPQNPAPSELMSYANNESHWTALVQALRRLPRPKASCVTKIRNIYGIHARPAAQFSRIANKFVSEILVTCNDISVNGHGMMGLLTLQAHQGAEILIEAVGPDAEEAVAALVQLIEQKFHEE